MLARLALLFLAAVEGQELICDGHEDFREGWVFSYLDAGPENNRCYGRHLFEDYPGFPKQEACADLCEGLSTPTNAYTMACFESDEKLKWISDQVAEKRGNAGTVGYVWASYVQDACTQEPDCGWGPNEWCSAGTHTTKWAFGEPSNVAQDISGEGGFLGMEEDCTILLLGDMQIPATLGATLPLMMDVNCETPNPDDLWCFCEYDPVLKLSPPPTPPPQVHGCSDHDEVYLGFPSPSGGYSDETWPNKCYGFVEPEENTYASCQASCAEVPGGKPICIGSEQEWEWLNAQDAAAAGIGAPISADGNLWYTWGAATYDDASDEFVYAEGACPATPDGGVDKWWAGEPNGIPFTGDCSLYLFGVTPDSLEFLGPSPLMAEIDCEAPQTDPALPPLCLCEFDEAYPPPEPPPPPTPPPNPPNRPLANSRPPYNGKVIGAAIGVCIAFTLCVVLPLFVLAYKMSVKYSVVTAADAAVSGKA